MQDDARRVDRAPQPGRSVRGGDREGARAEVARVGAGGDLLARLREGLACGRDGGGVRQPRDRLGAQKLVDRRQLPKLDA